MDILNIHSGKINNNQSINYFNDNFNYSWKSTTLYHATFFAFENIDTIAENIKNSYI